MKQLLLKIQFIMCVCLLVSCGQASDDDFSADDFSDDELKTKQITVKLKEAGTLPSKISSSKKYKITNLKIIGDINGTDFRFIREMAGRDSDGKLTEGHLASLDLSKANIVAGGDYYYINDYHYPYCYCEPNVVGKYAFYGCSSLTSVTIPSSVTEIGEMAFRECRGLTSITIPSSVTKIDSGVFLGCSGLTSVTIPSSVTEIGYGAFKSCTDLTRVTILSGVTRIGEYAFGDCYGLRSVTIPSSVTEIGEYAFGNCLDLRSVFVSWKTPLAISYCEFDSVNKDFCTLYVPKGTSDKYRLSEWGRSFYNIVEYDVTGMDNVTSSANAKEVSRYSVSGQRMNVPTKDLNIVRYSDGSVRKVAVQ